MSSLLARFTNAIPAISASQPLALDDPSSPPLLIYAKSGDLKRVARLLSTQSQIDACLDERDKWQQTALHKASRRGKFDVVRLLLRHGADVNVTDFIGYTAAQFAANYKHYEILSELIMAGSDVNYGADHVRSIREYIRRDPYIAMVINFAEPRRIERQAKLRHLLMDTAEELTGGQIFPDDVAKLVIGYVPSLPSFWDTPIGQPDVIEQFPFQHFVVSQKEHLGKMVSQSRSQLSKLGSWLHKGQAQVAALISNAVAADNDGTSTTGVAADNDGSSTTAVAAGNDGTSTAGVAADRSGSSRSSSAAAAPTAEDIASVDIDIDTDADLHDESTPTSNELASRARGTGLGCQASERSNVKETLDDHKHPETVDSRASSTQKRRSRRRSHKSSASSSAVLARIASSVATTPQLPTTSSVSTKAHSPPTLSVSTTPHSSMTFGLPTTPAPGVPDFPELPFVADEQRRPVASDSHRRLSAFERQPPSLLDAALSLPPLFDSPEEVPSAFGSPPHHQRSVVGVAS